MFVNTLNFTKFLFQSFGTLVNSVQKTAVHLSVFQHFFQEVVHVSVFTDLYGIFDVGHCEFNACIEQLVLKKIANNCSCLSDLRVSYRKRNGPIEHVFEKERNIDMILLRLSCLHSVYVGKQCRQLLSDARYFRCDHVAAHRNC